MNTAYLAVAALAFGCGGCDAWLNVRETASDRGLRARWTAPDEPEQEIPIDTPPAGLELEDRMWTVRARGYFSIAELAVPGYYTLILFSADWCEGCHALWQRVPDYIEKYPNLVAVEVDVAAQDETLAGPEAAILRGKTSGTLPGAILINPLGQTSQTIFGLEPICAMLDKMRSRKYRRPLPMTTLVPAPGGPRPLHSFGSR